MSETSRPSVQPRKAKRTPKRKSLFQKSRLQLQNFAASVPGKKGNSGRRFLRIISGLYVWFTQVTANLRILRGSKPADIVGCARRNLPVIDNDTEDGPLPRLENSATSPLKSARSRPLRDGQRSTVSVTPRSCGNRERCPRPAGRKRVISLL